MNAAALFICFFLSGATALIYEVVWVRLLALTFGNTVYAVGIVLTSFMSGLSLGSLTIGRWADKDRNLLKGYGILEWGIAISALISPLLLERVSGIYLSLSITSMPLWAVSIIRYLLSIAVLLLPTTLMGGTLPVLSRYFIRSEADLAKRLSQLYSLNTLGGVFGTFLVGFILVRFFGISMTLMFTAAVNIIIGSSAYYLGMQQPGPGTVTNHAREEGPRKSAYTFALGAFFLSGFTAMVYEISWSRLLVGIIGSTTYAFSIILIGFLFGIGLGSFVVSRYSGKNLLGLVHFSVLQICIGFCCFLTLLLFYLLPPLMLKGLQMTGNSYFAVMAVNMLLVLAYLLVPTTLFGATFPILAAIYSSGQTRTGTQIGTIYAANTFGAIFGSSLTAFYLIPFAGATASIKLASLVNILIGAAGFAVLRRFRLLLVAAGLLIIPLLPVSISDESLVSGVAVYGKQAGFTLTSETQVFLYLREGLNATIAVTTNDDGSIALSTNGKADGSTGADMSTQLASAYFPLLLHRNPVNLLIIGYGTGVTVRAAADFVGVENIETIEIEPKVIEAGNFFDQVSRGVLRDPRVKLYVDDARSHIMASERNYDLIISEPSNPWISGIGNLFSREFYEASRSRLNKGGLYCQWVQLYGLDPDVLRMIIRTFSSVFPETTIWQSNPADILLIGSSEIPIEFDYLQIAKRLSKTNSSDIRAYLHIFDPLDFLSYFVTGRQGVEKLSADAAVNTDNLPLLEFEAPFSLYSATERENNELLNAYMTIPEIRGFRSPQDLQQEYLFRKCLNYMKLGIPIDDLWLRSLSSVARSYLSGRIMVLDPKDPDRISFLQQAMNYHVVELPRNYEDLELLYVALDMALKYKNNTELRQVLQRVDAAPLHIVGHSNLYYRTGIGLERMGSRELAEKYLAKSIAVNEYNVSALTALADLYLADQRLPEACSSYRKAERMLKGSGREEVKRKQAVSCGS